MKQLWLFVAIGFVVPLFGSTNGDNPRDGHLHHQAGGDSASVMPMNEEPESEHDELDLGVEGTLAPQASFQQQLPSICIDALNSPEVVAARHRMEAYANVLQIMELGWNIWINRERLMQIVTLLSGDADEVADVLMSLGIELGSEFIEQHERDLVVMAATMMDRNFPGVSEKAIIQAYDRLEALQEEYAEPIAFVMNPREYLIEFAVEQVKAYFGWAQIERAFRMIKATPAQLDVAIEGGDAAALTHAARTAIDSTETMIRLGSRIEHRIIRAHWPILGGLTPKAALRRVDRELADEMFDHVYSAFDEMDKLLKRDAQAWIYLAEACSPVPVACGAPDHAPRSADDELREQWEDFECQFSRAEHPPRGCFGKRSYDRDGDGCPGTWSYCCPPDFAATAEDQPQ
jgi:hypothetical protein